MSEKNFLEFFNDAHIAQMVNETKQNGYTAREFAELVYIPIMTSEDTASVAKSFSEREEKFYYDVFVRAYELYGEDCPFTEEDFSLEERVVQDDLFVEIIDFPKSHFESQSFLQLYLVMDLRGDNADMYIATIERDKEQNEIIYTIDLETFEWKNHGMAAISIGSRVQQIFKILLNEDISVYDYVMFRCPVCHNEFGLGLYHEEWEGYRKFCLGDEVLEDVIPTLNAFEREFLITGMCPDCQVKLFNKELPKDLNRWKRF